MMTISEIKEKLTTATNPVAKALHQVAENEDSLCILTQGN
jgi:hypothetical protein